VVEQVEPTRRTPEMLRTDEELNAEAESYQRQIDEYETKLEEQGINIVHMYRPSDPSSSQLAGFEDYVPMPLELEALYNKRDAIDEGQLDKSIDTISQSLRESGLSEIEVTRILEKYSLSRGRPGDTRVYVAAQHTQRAASVDPRKQAEDVYIALAAERGIPMDSAGDLWRDQKTTEDTVKAVGAIWRFFHGDAVPVDIRSDVSSSAHPRLTIPVEPLLIEQPETPISESSVHNMADDLLDTQLEELAAAEPELYKTVRVESEAGGEVRDVSLEEHADMVNDEVTLLRQVASCFIAGV